jgi:hypothetical protein
MDAIEIAGDRELVTVQELARRVRLSVDHLGRPGLRLIDIEVNGNTVVLSGRVGTFHQKQLASAFAGRVAGVSKVFNQLEVHDGVRDDAPQQSNGFAVHTEM